MKWLRGLNLGSSEQFGESCKEQVMGNTGGQACNIIKGVWWHHKPERQICSDVATTLMWLYGIFSRRNFILAEWVDMIF